MHALNLDSFMLKAVQVYLIFIVISLCYSAFACLYLLMHRLADFLAPIFFLHTM